MIQNFGIDYSVSAVTMAACPQSGRGCPLPLFLFAFGLFPFFGLFGNAGDHKRFFVFVHLREHVRRPVELKEATVEDGGFGVPVL